MLTVSKSFIFLRCPQGCMAMGVMPVCPMCPAPGGSLRRPELLCNCLSGLFSTFLFFFPPIFACVHSLPLFSSFISLPCLY